MTMIAYRQALAVLLGSLLISAGAWAAQEGEPFKHPGIQGVQGVTAQPHTALNRVSFVKMDTDNDGRVSSAEARLLPAPFGRMDTDRNGYLSPQEYRYLIN
ncbi:hypothetical protein [Halomonas ramblicola]|uniref:hypothetical protein n=1 Tax=Halomonas ramblicola TaxID=747349 RepID=UPI0025B30F20|nr:hypothetical protein [Halomonas ramblicola]MDN3519977.1 hypothetical protein [Halomonas ramblicola]